MAWTFKCLVGADGSQGLVGPTAYHLVYNYSAFYTICQPHLFLGNDEVYNCSEEDDDNQDRDDKPRYTI